jgi:hypothetical protein
LNDEAREGCAGGGAEKDADGISRETFAPIMQEEELNDEARSH